MNTPNLPFYSPIGASLPPARSKAADFQGFLSEIRKTLNFTEYRVIMAKDIANRYRLSYQFLPLLIKKAFLDVQKMGRGKQLGYRMNDRTGQLTDLRLAKLYEQVLDVARIRRQDSRKKKREAPVELQKLESVNPPNSGLLAGVSIAGNPLVGDLPAGYPQAETLQSKTIPVQQPPMVKPKDDRKLTSKQMQVEWTIDGVSCGLSVTVTGPEEGVDYKTILKRGLALLDVNLNE